MVTGERRRGTERLNDQPEIDRCTFCGHVSIIDEGLCETGITGEFGAYNSRDYVGSALLKCSPGNWRIQADRK